MRWLEHVLAVIGALTLALIAAAVLLAFRARRAEDRKRRAWRDQHLLQVGRERGPEVVAANPSTWDQFVEAHGLKAPRGYRP